ncbi:MAG: esterase, partial [Holdemania filiformis]
MHTAYYNEYSYHLDRMMEFKVYGHAGRPCLVFPAQSGRFYDFENFGMVAAVQDLLEQGRLQLFTCDSIDWETWAAFDRECRGRIERHEAYA